MTTKLEKERLTIAKLPRPLVLNFFTIADEEWAKARFGGTAEMFDEIKRGEIDSILYVLWRLMDDESKRMIAHVKLLQWDGLIEKPLELDDPVDRLKHLVGGADEAQAIVMAIITTVTRKSWPDVVESAKKKIQAAAQSRIPNSSTSSLPNTGGDETRSESTLDVNSVS